MELDGPSGLDTQFQDWINLLPYLSLFLDNMEVDCCRFSTFLRSKDIDEFKNYDLESGLKLSWPFEDNLRLQLFRCLSALINWVDVESTILKVDVVIILEWTRFYMRYSSRIAKHRMQVQRKYTNAVKSNCLLLILLMILLRIVPVFPSDSEDFRNDDDE